MFKSSRVVLAKRVADFKQVKIGCGAAFSGDRKASIWVTYSWADNKGQDVDFLAQELKAKGLTVKLDRWNITAGNRLWQQIDNFICNPAECDAWLIYATANSLGSEACKEEFGYAIDRAINSRGQSFPVIALFPASVDPSLIPAGIRTRLHVSLRDVDWIERVASVTEGRQPILTQSTVAPYYVHVHQMAVAGFAIEVRPRAGNWTPTVLAVPVSEVDRVQPRIAHGPAGRLPCGMQVLFGTGTRQQGGWHVMSAQNEATPTMSYFLLCKSMPSSLVFGEDSDANRRYEAKFTPTV